MVQKACAIPNNFAENLPNLKEQTLKWSIDIKLDGENFHAGDISYYSVGDAARGNFILVPGLASNTATEPLMKALTWWSLTNRYNVYCLDTFLGDFKPTVTMDDAVRNTIPKFIDVVDTGLDIIGKHCDGAWTCMVGHSLGANATFEILNRRVIANQPTHLSAAIVFAPFVCKSCLEWIVDYQRKRQCPPDISDAEFKNYPLGMCSPQDAAMSKQIRYISVLPKFFDDLDKMTPKPHLMNKYDIPVTIVAGGRDKKAPLERLQGIYETMRRMSNASKFKLVVFPKSKHSFINQYRDYAAVVNLIKSVRLRKPRHK